MSCVLFRKVVDLQFALDEVSIEKADAEVIDFCHVGFGLLSARTFTGFMQLKIHGVNASHCELQCFILGVQ